MNIICCKCGVIIQPSPLNMCINCTASETHFTSFINNNRIVEHCRQCDRYHAPPRSWFTLPWNSKELLAFLLKQNTQLNKLCIIDADFVYTEEHSKRIEYACIIEHNQVKKQVNINYKIKNKQCPDCQKIEAKQYWTSVVQVRQRVVHKKTLLYLEQLILQAKAFNDTSNIKERKEGIDFYYQTKTPALKMIAFIQKSILSRVKTSEQLVTEDLKSNKSKYKFCYSVEIAPVCRDDIVTLSDRVAMKYGINPINIVLKVNSSIKLIDPISMKVTKIDARNYWGYKDEFKVLMSGKSLRKFEIVEIEKNDLKVGKFNQSDVFVTSGENEIYHCKSHLGNLLKEGGEVLGYDFKHSSIDVEGFQIYLIRKEKKRNRRRVKKAVVDEGMMFEAICESSKNDKLTRELENLDI